MLLLDQCYQVSVTRLLLLVKGVCTQDKANHSQQRATQEQVVNCCSETEGSPEQTRLLLQHLQQQMMPKEKEVKNHFREKNRVA